MFDEPVFKILAKNDTGAASGHQGGMVIPKALGEYLPDIQGTISASNPAPDQKIEAELFLDGTYKGTVATRYQYQTWGGTRSPERRLTDNLGPIRGVAKAGDILLIERSLEDPLHFRISVETTKSTSYGALKKLIGIRQWGVLRPDLEPAPNDEVSKALAEIVARQTLPPVLIDPSRPSRTSLVTKKIRNQAFRQNLLHLYSRHCAISGTSLEQPPSVSGLDAAHVIPVEAGGTDDPRNGLLLAKDIHWAFDNGLVVISNKRIVEIPPIVRAIAANQYLRAFHGRPLADPTPPVLRVDDQALNWHRNAAMEKLAARL